MPILLHARVYDIWFQKPNLETMGRWNQWHELTVISPRSLYTMDSGESRLERNLTRYITYPASLEGVPEPTIQTGVWFNRPKSLKSKTFLCSIDYGHFDPLNPVRWYLRTDQLGTWLGAPMEPPHVCLPPDILADWMEDKSADDERFTLPVLRLREILKNQY